MKNTLGSLNFVHFPVLETISHNSAPLLIKPLMGTARNSAVFKY